MFLSFNMSFLIYYGRLRYGHLRWLPCDAKYTFKYEGVLSKKRLSPGRSLSRKTLLNDVLMLACVYAQQDFNLYSFYFNLSFSYFKMESFCFNLNSYLFILNSRCFTLMSSCSGVEVFVFHWGCTRPRGPGNDQRGPTVCSHGGTESLPPLLDNFFQAILGQTCS